MGETLHAQTITFRDRPAMTNVTVVLEENFIIVMDKVTGKRSEVITWAEILTIML